MISFILLNNLNFSCCIGYPHTHKSTTKCSIIYHSLNVGFWSTVFTWPYPPTIGQCPATCSTACSFACIRSTPLILQLRNFVLNFDWMPPRNWRHLCKRKSSSQNKSITSRQLRNFIWWQYKLWKPVRMLNNV